MKAILKTDKYAVELKKQTRYRGSKLSELAITDKYHAPRYRVLSVLVNGFLHTLERILIALPSLHAEHKGNFVRWMVYAPPGIRSWSQYMPGAFATHPVHNTEVTHLKDGTKLDIVTRNLFRHGDDAVGLRARAYAMAWYVWREYGKATDVRWLSLATGTAQQTYDGVAVLAHRPQLWLTDVDDEALAVARAHADDYGMADHVVVKRLDATNRAALQKAIRAHHPQVIDMMGLMEYLDDAAATALIKQVRAVMPSGGSFIFTNMLPTHPGLQVHKRALGWPGVIVRSIDQVADLVIAAGVAPAELEILAPTDGIYGIFCIKAA